MTTDDLLQQLRRQDVLIWADGDRLRVNAPPSVLTPGLKAELAARKLEIREVLEARSGRRSSIVPIQPSGSRPAFYGIASVGDGFSWVGSPASSDRTIRSMRSRLRESTGRSRR